MPNKYPGRDMITRIVVHKYLDIDGPKCVKSEEITGDNLVEFLQKVIRLAWEQQLEHPNVPEDQLMDPTIGAIMDGEFGPMFQMFPLVYDI